MWSRIGIALLIAGLAGGAIVVGQLTAAPAVEALATEHDFGRHDVTDAPMRLTHTFEITNPTVQPLRVIRVNSSCGCVITDVTDKTVIEPDGVQPMTVEFTLKGTGRQRQHIWIDFDRGPRRSYALTATGKTVHSLVSIPTRVRLDSASKASIRLERVDYRAEEATEGPRIEAAEGAGSTFAGWTLIEKRDEAMDRPTRQLGTMTLDFADYTGELPIKVTLVDVSGARCEITVLK